MNNLAFQTLIQEGKILYCQCNSCYSGVITVKSHLDGVVGVGDDRDEKAEDHVDEERHKGVEVNPAEDPHHAVLVLHVLEGGKHVVSVDQGEEALGYSVQGPELRQREQRDHLLLSQRPSDTVQPKKSENTCKKRWICTKELVQVIANLLVIGSEHNPAAEAVADVNDSSTADKADHIWERCPKRQDENLSIDVIDTMMKVQRSETQS